jgi:hypothetical protein
MDYQPHASTIPLCVVEFMDQSSMLVKILIGCFVSIVVLPNVETFNSLFSKQDYITKINYCQPIIWNYTTSKYNYITTEEFIESMNTKYQDIFR